MKEELETLKSIVKRYEAVEEKRQKVVQKSKDLEDEEDKLVETLSELELVISSLFFLEFGYQFHMNFDIEKVKKQLEEAGEKKK
jgi:hypothetical protein